MPSLTPDARRIYGLTGGMLMDAVVLNQNLSRDEKFVLATIVGRMNLGSDYTESCWLYVEEICRRTSISRRQVFRVLSALEERKYIEREKQWQEGAATKQMASNFRLTGKVFREFEASSNVRIMRKTGVQ